VHRPATADYPAGARLETRVIGDYELVWMLRGRAELVGDPRVTLGAADLVLVPPEWPHGFEWDRGRPSRHGYVHFGAADTSAALPSLPRHHPMSPDDPLAGLCAYLLWLGLSGHPEWSVSARPVLDLLLTLLIDGPLPDADGARRLPPALEAAVRVLRSQWQDPPLRRVGAGWLAAAVHVSRGHLNRLSREAFGLPVAEALERARCSRVEALLTHTDLPLERVAEQCGFADAVHLSHRFRVIYGMPPSAFRAGAAGGSVLDHPGVRRLVRLVWD